MSNETDVIMNERESPTEEEIVQALLSGKPVRVYHSLDRPEDFEAVVEQGFRGSYTIRKTPTDRSPLEGEGGLPLRKAYFYLLKPENASPNDIYLDLNVVGDPQTIIDARDISDVETAELVGLGYDGQITLSGVSPNSACKFMLTIFDGATLKGMAKRLIEVTSTNPLPDDNIQA